MTDTLPEWMEKEVISALDRPGGESSLLIEALCAKYQDHATAIRRIVALASESDVPRTIGPYRILHRIGAGGMGTVYAAERRAPVHMRVAIKVIKLGMDSRAMLVRFEAEREALARMSHPNIAQVLDAGVTERGQPFYVMELVRGQRIDHFCDTRRLSIRQRVGLFLQLCGGVQHAHHKGIIHRDLKPANVLVEETSGTNSVKIIDFGLARATAGRLTDHTCYTEPGQIMGTLEFMSPEQVDMAPTDIDTRTDVYSLGVMLHVLLVGGVPLRHSSSLEEFRRRLLDEEARRMSHWLTNEANGAAIARSRGATVGPMLRTLRGELDWIVMKALAKDRARRYQTPSELAGDLQRFLDGDPVQARPPSAVYRIRRLASRYRAQTLSLVVMAGTVLAGLVISFGYYRQAERAQNRAETALMEYERLADAARLRRLRRQALELQEQPSSVGAFDSWLTAAQELLAQAPTHRDALAKLAASGANESDDVGIDPALQFRYDESRSLLAGLEALSGASGEWELVRRGRDWLGSLANSKAYDAAWLSVAEELSRDARFSTFPHPLKPQMGLVPLGRDAASGLQEFAVPRSGAVPVRDELGRLMRNEDCALVLVLIPPGSCVIGARIDDDLAAPSERPCRVATISALFISKYEVSQSQWRRLTLQNPSRHQPGSTLGVTAAHPVEDLSYSDATTHLARHGLRLPLEVEWEYAARAGTATRFWFGDSIGDIAREGPLANIADLQGRIQGYTDTGLLPTYDDGHVVHAPVGTFPPNPFGLHEVLGNVYEWCADRWRDSSEAADAHPEATYVVRGGSYGTSIALARCSHRRSLAPESRRELVGLRPVREVQ